MKKKTPLITLILFVFLIFLVVGLSLISNRIWGDRPESPPELNELIIEKEMTISEFGRTNELPDKVLKEIFDLKDKSDLGKRLSEYGTTKQISSLANKKLALSSEHASKNWIKIPIKFVFWFVFLSATYVLLRNRKAMSTLRKWLLFVAVLLFGVTMGADPSPMGTVKDAIHLYGKAHAFFPPRMIALAIFLTIVFIANKYICAWGCQIGTLQDLIYRINQTEKRKAVIGRQIKLPFAFTNTLRFLFFGVFTLIAFLSGIDIVEPIDPFKIFKPLYLGVVGGTFIGLLLVASLFLYRPWCHLFCPFGLVGWIIEKVSLFKISVDYETCIACQKCAAVCPSTVMSAILRRDKITIPDCFACYTCREVCPTDSIRFSNRRRMLPPSGHFANRKKSERISEHFKK